MTQEPLEGRHIVVGVVPGQPDAVVATAARFAKRFGAPVTCAWVDSARYAVATLVDGEVVSLPVDPDVAEEAVEAMEERLRAAVTAVLEAAGVSGEVRALAGSPAHELARLADELDAEMIVVGTRDPGFMGTVREFFNGSVAATLAHTQHRPVVVVPLNPVDPGAALPWSGAEA